MKERLAVLINQAKNATRYYWTVFLVKIGLAYDQTNAKCRKLPPDEITDDYNHEVTTVNKRTGRKQKSKALLFSQKEMKKIHKSQTKIGI